MPEEIFVRHCSATMAGLKTGNLFSCPDYCECEVREFVKSLNQKLGCKGLRAVMMTTEDHRCLVYAYRPKLLEKDLENSSARAKLSELGYCCDNQSKCVAQLAKKIKHCKTFPHEIGFFLGYPANDVIGFIQNKRCAKCVGCWKVYDDEQSAEKTFAKYKKCERVYYNSYKQGRVLEKLTVAV